MSVVGNAYGTSVDLVAHFIEHLPEVVEHLRLDIPTRWEIAKGDVRLSGAIFEIDTSAGRCTAARRVQITRE